jgi:hypothetical protein
MRQQVDCTLHRLFGGPCPMQLARQLALFALYSFLRHTYTFNSTSYYSTHLQLHRRYHCHVFHPLNTRNLGMGSAVSTSQAVTSLGVGDADRH